MPLHLGIIPDGNRRYCQENNASLKDVVNILYTNVIHIFTIISTGGKPNKYRNIKDITELSIYMISYDNLMKRDENQLKVIFDFINRLCDYIITSTDIIHRTLFNKINLLIVGRIKELPENLQKLIYRINKRNEGIVEQAAKTKTVLFTITLAIAYDPIQDMYNIVNNIDKRIQTPIDLIIRSSGEKRLSGFFPCHSLYSELLFINNNWPEIELCDIDDSIDIYYKRNRRFGK